MKPQITVVGSSNVDLILNLPRFPKPGETVLGGRFLTAQGGKGANQAVAASRAGADIHFVTRTGRDTMGAQALAAYREERMRLDYSVVDDAGPNGVAVIFVDAEGRNCIGVAPGANNCLDRNQVQTARSAIESSRLLLVQLEIPLASVSEAVAIARAAGVPVILNPAPAQPLDDALLETVSVLTPNETEAETLTGIALTSDDRIRDAALFLRGKGVDTVIITLGERGVYVASESLNAFVPGFPVRAIDTTAAGDVFNGALAVALGEEMPLYDAVRFGCAAAAISVTTPGAQPSAPFRADIELFIHHRLDTDGQHH